MGCNLSRDDRKKAIRRETNATHTSPQGLAKRPIATKMETRMILARNDEREVLLRK